MAERQDELGLQECNTCMASVQTKRMGMHQNWHQNLDRLTLQMKRDIEKLQRGGGSPGRW